MASKNLQPVLAELHKAFDFLNKAYYENKLPQVVIAIHPMGNSNANGWFTPAKLWSDGEEDKHEICITAETMNREAMDIMRTLHHEMIHLYCHENDIKETSRKGAYHNKLFKEECLKRGFYYPDNTPDKKIGWSFAQLLPETIERFKTWDVDYSVFGLARKGLGTGEKKKKTSNIIKWVCPSCGAIVRSSKLEGIKPYCMNDEEGAKEPCACFFEPEIPEGFVGKIPLTQAETEVLEAIVEYYDAEKNEVGCYPDGMLIDDLTAKFDNELIAIELLKLLYKKLMITTYTEDGEAYASLTDRTKMDYKLTEA